MGCFCIFKGLCRKLNFSYFHSGTKYDLDSKSPNKSGQNFKSVEDMIDMYKELCSGIAASF